MVDPVWGNGFHAHVPVALDEDGRVLPGSISYRRSELDSFVQRVAVRGCPWILLSMVVVRAGYSDHS